MPRNQSLLLLGIAVLIGLLAVILANNYLGRADNRNHPGVAGAVKVAVARMPLETGTQLTPDKVRFVDWPGDSVPPGAIVTLAALSANGTPRVALRPIEANEPLLLSRLSGPGGRATLAAVLQPDMRAIAVRVNDVTGAGGFVLPGDVVDVLVTRAPPGAPGGAQITDVLLQNIRVIAVDQNSNDTKTDPVVGKTATLEVTQVDAQKLMLAQQVGTLSLALRNPAQQNRTLVQTVGVDDLRDGAAARPALAFTPASPPSAAPRRRAPHIPVRLGAPSQSVQIIRGIKPSEYQVGLYAGY